MTLKTGLESEKDMSTPESIENFETTTSRLEDSTPSNTNDMTKSGQNNFFNLRSLISKLTQPSLSTVDFVLLVLVEVCLAAFTQDTCDRLPTALRAPQLGTAWVIPQPGIYVVADGRLTRKPRQLHDYKIELLAALPFAQYHIATFFMAWTQDDLQSLELLLESKLRDKRSSPIEMDQEQSRRHHTKKNKLEQGRVPVLEPSLCNALREPTRQVEPESWKWGVTLLIYVFAFCLMYFSPKKESTAAPIAENTQAMITEYHIQVKQPGNYTMAVPSIWSVASTSVVTETVTTTTTQEITKTVTATTTEKPTATVTVCHWNESQKDACKDYIIRRLAVERGYRIYE
ncbi:hypothetical protein KCU95_g902, partial [Aureobasidium melanogenum]